MSFLLNRGGAGKSVTRAETVTEISTLVERHIALLGSYADLRHELGSDESASSVQELERDHRVDIAKLSEIVLSSSGAPPRKADPLGGTDTDSLLRVLNDGERSLREAIEAQLTKKHHRRTLAVLETQLANTENRLGVLQQLARQYSVPIG